MWRTNYLEQLKAENTESSVTFDAHEVAKSIGLRRKEHCGNKNGFV